MCRSLSGYACLWSRASDRCDQVIAVMMQSYWRDGEDLRFYVVGSLSAHARDSKTG